MRFDESGWKGGEGQNLSRGAKKRSQRSIPVTQWLSRALEHGSESGCNMASLLRSASLRLRGSNALLRHLYLCPCLHVGGAGNDGRGLFAAFTNGSLRFTYFPLWSRWCVQVPTYRHVSVAPAWRDHKGSSVWSTVGL